QSATRPGEIVQRGGRLDPTSVSNPRELGTYPFDPKRSAPPDPTVSEVEAFSNCLWDDGWPGLLAGSCSLVPRGAGGGAGAVASADVQTFGALPTLFAAVFADDRTGVSE